MDFSSKLLFLFGLLVVLISSGDSLFLKKKVIVHHVHPEPHFHPHPIIYKKFPVFEEVYDHHHHDHGHHHHLHHDHHDHHHHSHHPHHDWHHPWW